MVASFLSKHVSQIFSCVFDVGEVDGPILLTGGSNCKEGCVCLCSTGNIVGGVQKLLLDSVLQHPTELRLMKRSLSFTNLFYSRFINVYSYCPDAAGREGCCGAQADVAHSNDRDGGSFGLPSRQAVFARNYKVWAISRFLWDERRSWTRLKGGGASRQA